MRWKTLMATLMMAFLASLSLVACGTAEEDDSVQARVQRNNEKLRTSYETVTGVYDGRIQTVDSSHPLPVQIFMYVDTIQDGVDPDGAPKSRPIMRAQLRLGVIGELDDHNFLVDYNTINGQIRFTQAPGSNGDLRTCSVGPRDPLLSFTGSLLEGEMRGSFNGSNGLLGDAKLARTSTQSAQPIRDQRKRLLEAYAKAEGTYRGALEDADGKLASTIIINVVEQAVGGGVTCPSLRAQFRLEDTVGKIDDSVLAVEYRESTGEIYFTPSKEQTPTTVRVCPMGPKDSQLAIDGMFFTKGGAINGDVRGTNGSLGRLTLVKTSTATSAANDQRERLERALSQATGTYAARFKGSDKSFPIKIHVTMQDENIGGFVTCPVLRAQYVRPDLTDGVGAMVLKVDFFPATKQIVMKSATLPTGGIPGNKDLTINAKWSRGEFQGVMNWWDKTGTITAIRCKSTSVDSKGRCR